ncbi:MAG: biotin--[acetyl-CoA-carboxylase] ligase [Mariprofundales bacterium]|nr:biotin--[acetyl-CoA-carboxylase] ligase [Mariprofundales bacterium]
MIAPTPLHLPDSQISWHHLALDSVDSTNDVALRQAEEGAAEGLIVTARSQRCGRGRLGRRWQSGTDESLIMSVLLRPTWLPPQRASTLSLLTALALFDALNLPNSRLKWPNDLLVDGKKIAGILTEMRTGTATDGTRINAVVIGIGINLRTPHDGWANNFRLPATSLAEQNVDSDANVWLPRILLQLDRRYTQLRAQGFTPIANAWWQAHGDGHMVRVNEGSQPWQGTAIKLDDDGALLVARDNGIQRVVTADVIHLPQLLSTH